MSQSSDVLENYDTILQVDGKSDYRFLTDPAQMSCLLNSQTTPSERLMILAKSTIDTAKQPTIEAQMARNFIATSTLMGFTFGFFFNSRDIHDKFYRQHNASVFEGHYRASRAYWDTLILGSGSRGLGWAFKTFVLSSCATSISLGSVVGRNQLYLPDWLIGYTVLGGLSRLWLGYRGVVFGTSAGFLTGLTLFGMVWSLEKATGISTTQFRYRSFVEHTDKMEANLMHMRMLRQQNLISEGIIEDEPRRT